jgi:hypothetical protein
VLLGWFASIENNPLIRMEAQVGLSPAPLERFLGIKNFFSGMTEGAHRLAKFDFIGSLEANIFTPFFLGAIVIAILTWRVPKIDSRAKELVFFGGFIGLSVMVNLIHK